MRLSHLNSKLAVAKLAIFSLSVTLLILSVFFLPFNLETLFYIALFTLAIFLTDYIIIEVSKEIKIPASTAIILTGLFLGTGKIPLGIIILSVSFGTFFSWAASRKNTLKILINSAKRILAISLTAAVIWLWFFLVGSFHIFALRLVAAILATAIYFAVETTIETVLISLGDELSFKTTFSSQVRLAALIYFTFSVVALLMAMMFKWMDFWSILIFSLPLAVIGESFKLYLDINKTYASTIKALSTAVEAKDTRRGGHAERVTDYAVATGSQLGLYGKELNKLSYAAMLHDIGKLGFDRDTLAHAKVGAEIVRQVDYLKEVSSIIKHHHYNNDSGKVDVPLESKIIYLADAYDHMVSDEKLNKREALSKIKADKGLVYDSGVIRAFVKVMEGKGA